MFKLKVATNEENYKEVVLKRAIILCWILLFICFIIKIFGGNFFNIVCNNERFVKLCEFIDSTLIYYLIAFIFYLPSTFIYYYTVSCVGNLNKRNSIIIILSCIICFCIKWINHTIGMILEFISYFIITYIICKTNGKSNKESLLRIIIGFILNNLFQIVSLFVKNLGLFKIMENNSLIQIIFSIDYYIMLILYLLYSLKIYIKKEV